MTDFPCPCCGYRTLEKPSPGSFEICGICGWEDDAVQFSDPDETGGANRLSLRQAQERVRELEERGALKRAPGLGEARESDWTFLDP